jgi:hypothetical protein
VENGCLAPSPNPSTLEERVGAQALAIDLKQAALACLSGQESRRWTVGELFCRLKNLGVPCSRASLTGALGELGLELSLCPWAPWRLAERGQEWLLEPKSELAELLSGVRKLPLSDPGRLSDDHKAVLLVVIGHRRKGGVSKTRVGEILGLDASAYLEELRRLELVYTDPARELPFWRPRSEALLALGFRASADVPELKELENWFDGQKLDAALTKVKPARRLKRELKRRASVGSAASGEPSSGSGGGALQSGEEGRADFLGGEASLPSPGQPPERVVKGLAGQGRAARPGKQQR